MATVYGSVIQDYIPVEEGDLELLLGQKVEILEINGEISFGKNVHTDCYGNFPTKAIRVENKQQQQQATDENDKRTAVVNSLPQQVLPKMQQQGRSVSSSSVALVAPPPPIPYDGGADLVGPTFAKALYNYAPQSMEEMKLDAGAVFEVCVIGPTGGWSLGKNGRFPTDYAILIQPNASLAPPPPPPPPGSYRMPQQAGMQKSGLRNEGRNFDSYHDTQDLVYDMKNQLSVQRQPYRVSSNQSAGPISYGLGNMQRTDEVTDEEFANFGYGFASNSSPRSNQQNQQQSARRSQQQRGALPQRQAAEKGRKVDQFTRRSFMSDTAQQSIIVLGETGSGKSTFINIATNYFRNGNLQQLKVLIPNKFNRATERDSVHSERNMQHSDESQTNDCAPYRFQVDGSTFVILDTPGLGDTRGPGQDQINLQIIMEAVEKQSNISAVVFIINGQSPRYTLVIKSCMVNLKGILPDIVFENIIIVFTRVIAKELCQYDFSKLPIDVKDENMFFMANNAFTLDMTTCSPVVLEAEVRNWDLCMKEFERMVLRVQQLRPKEVGRIMHLIRTNRDDVKAALHKVKLNVRTLQDVQASLDHFERAVKTGEASMNQYANYRTKKTVQEVRLVDAPYHSTICGNCNEVCHDNCGLNEIYNKGSQDFKMCAACGGNDNCLVCKSKCHYSYHYHANKTVQHFEKVLDEVLGDIKDKYDTAVQSVAQATGQLGTLESDKKAVEAAIDSEIRTLQAKCEEIKHHCSGFNLAAELSITLEQLRTELRMINNSKAMATAKKFVETITRIIDGLNRGHGISEFEHEDMFSRPIATAAAPPRSVASRFAAATSAVFSSSFGAPHNDDDEES